MSVTSATSAHAWGETFSVYQPIDCCFVRRTPQHLPKLQLYETIEPLDSLKCAVSLQFKDKLTLMGNYRSAFIEGTMNVRTSTLTTDKHACAMMLIKNTWAISPSILDRSCFGSSSIDTMREETKQKFDIAYTIARETLSFTNMKTLCKLEQWHGVD